MPVLALLSAFLVIAVEQLVQSKYGTTGIIGLLLLTIGLKARNPAVSSVGAAVLALRVNSPAV